MTNIISKLSLIASLIFTTSAFAGGGSPAPVDNFKPLNTYGTNRPFDQYAWLTAHNAFASDDYGWTHRMQSMDIPDMLDMGTRGLMLDIHNSNGGIYLCHSSCARDGLRGPLLWKSMLSFTWSLNTVGDWLNKHPNEVVTLILEDYISDRNQFNAAITASNYEHMIFDAEGQGVNTASNSWPTLQQMINSNKRIVILTSKSNNGHSPYASHEWKYTVGNTYNIGVPGFTRDYSCTNRGESSALNTAAAGGSNPHKMFVFNHFRSTPEYFSATGDNKDVLSRWQNYCNSVGAPLPNFVSVDYVERGNPLSAVNEFNRRWAQ